MQVNSKISFLFISLIVIGFIGGGWYFYNQMFQGIKNPVTVVPDDAAIIIEIPNIKTFIKDWKTNSSYEKATKEMPYIKNTIKWLPLLFSQLQKHSDGFSDWNSSKLVMSLHSKGYLLLFSNTNMQLQDLQNEILSSLPQKINIQEKTINSAYYLKTEIESQALVISERRGIFMFSNSIEILEKAIQNTHKPNHFSISKEFLSLEKVSGKRADAHVFVNYKNLDEVSTSLKLKLPSPIWNHQNQIASWTGLDLNLKPKEILLNGYTILNDTNSSFLNIFKGQKSQDMSLPDNFPYQTRCYQHISISDYSSFFLAWKAYLQSSQEWKGMEKNFTKIKKSLKTNHIEITNKWWAGEMAQLKTKKGKEYALFLGKKGRESFRALSEIAHLSQPSMISMEYKGVKMKEINFPYYLYTQFGPSFANFKKTYFAVIDELVIFAHNIKDLKAYLDLLEDGHILNKNEDYLAFSDNLSKNSNFTFYIKSPNTKNGLFQSLPTALQKELSSKAFVKKDLAGFGLQLNWKNKMLYTGIFADLAGKVITNSSQWQVNLDSHIISGPFIVKDHSNNSHKYIVFDDFRQMYLINEQGDIVWKKQLEELPMSDVFEVDYYKNGKIQYLFNTENYLHLIDLTGNMVKGYPVQLNSSATAGLSLIDYNANKDYRILIPTENGKIYNYKKDGSLLKGWKSKNTRRTIIKPISHVVANSKDYLIAEADNGNILMFNRKGEVRLEIRKSFSNALGSNIFANRTNSKGMMVTTDTEGKFIYIPEKGKVKTTDFGTFSKEHYFIYTDFTGNGNYDFIYLDGQALTVYDKFKKSILSYVFEHPIQSKPKVFTVSGRKVLGVLDKESQKLYIFNSNGLISSKFVGNTDFIIDDGETPIVLIGKGKALMKYSLD